MKKDIFAGTFLEEARNYKGPIRHVPKDFYEKSLLNEEFLDRMNEGEKKILCVFLQEKRNIQKLLFKVCSRKDHNPPFIKNEHPLTTWIRKSTEDEKYELDDLKSRLICIQKTLLSLITSRFEALPEGYILTLRPRHKIVMGIPDRSDPITKSYPASIFYNKTISETIN